MANFPNCSLPKLVTGLVILFSVVSTTYSQRQIDPELEAKINDFIQNVYFPISNTSSLALAIVQGDDIFYTNGFGLSDIDKDIPTGNHTEFCIGSISKSFTAAALTKALHEKFPDLGETVLDTPIRKLVPQLNFTLIDRFRSEYGNVRDLLSHRVCLFRDDLQQTAHVFDTSQEIAYRQRYSAERCGLRTEFRYSNQMYAYAGEVLSSLTNKKYEDVVGDFFKELGMSNSSFTYMSDDFSKMPYRAQPYYILDGEIHSFNSEMVKRVEPWNAVGGVFSTANDMARYIKFHLNLGKVDGKQVIPEEVMKWIRKPAIYSFRLEEGVGAYINTYGYGLGLMTAAYETLEYFQHGGYTPPYGSHLSLLPSENIGIFTSTNQAPMPTLTFPVVLHVFIIETLRGADNALEKALNVWEDLRNTKQKKSQQRVKAIERFLESSKTFAGGRKPNAEDIVGKYGSGTAGDAEIVEMWNDETNEVGLFLTYGKLAHGWLEHVAGVTYKLNFVTDLIQDDYAIGLKESSTFVRVYDETLEFVMITAESEDSISKLKLGVSLDKLPPIPWLPGSCGPE